MSFIPDCDCSTIYSYLDPAKIVHICKQISRCVLLAGQELQNKIGCIIEYKSKLPETAFLSSGNNSTDILSQKSTYFFQCIENIFIYKMCVPFSPPYKHLPLPVAWVLYMISSYHHYGGMALLTCKASSFSPLGCLAQIATQVSS